MTTNRDKINAMTNEELAEFLNETTNCDRCSRMCQSCFCFNSEICIKRIGEWLESEVEDG